MSEERSKESIIERVRKILLKTEQAGCSADESEKAFAIASRLMAEHNLSMDEVEKREGGEQSWLEDDAYETGRWTLEDNLAYGIVHRYFFVEAYFGYKHIEDKKGNYRQVKILRFFGRPDNVETAKWTFNALLGTFDRLFRGYRDRTGALASDRRIFVSGVANGFTQKMHDERRAMEVEGDLVQNKTSGSTALALTGIREQTIMAYKEAHAGHFKKDGSKRGSSIRFSTVSGSASAFEAGQHAGLSLNLNRSIGSGGRSPRRGLTGS